MVFLLTWLYANDLELHFAAFVGVFFYGIADVEGTARLYQPSLRALSEGDAVHDGIALMVNEFQLDMLLSASHNLAGSIVVNLSCAEHRAFVFGTKGREAVQLAIEVDVNIRSEERRVGKE